MPVSVGTPQLVWGNSALRPMPRFRPCKQHSATKMQEFERGRRSQSRESRGINNERDLLNCQRIPSVSRAEGKSFLRIAETAQQEFGFQTIPTSRSQSKSCSYGGDQIVRQTVIDVLVKSKPLHPRISFGVGQLCIVKLPTSRSLSELILLQ